MFTLTSILQTPNIHIRGLPCFLSFRRISLRAAACVVATGPFELTLAFGLRNAGQGKQLKAQQGLATKYLGTGPPGRSQYCCYATWAGNPIVRLLNRSIRRSGWGESRRCRLPGARTALPCRPEVPLVVFFKLSMLTMDGGAAVSGGPLTVQSTAVLTAAFHVERMATDRRRVRRS